MPEAHLAPSLRRAAPLPLDIEQPQFSLQIERGIGFAKLRIYGAQADAQYKAIVGIAPPAAGEQIVSEDLTFAWLGPCEWMASGPEDKTAQWLANIEKAGHEDALAIDLTHARTAFILSDAKARDAIAAHCPLDLWPGVFPVNTAARSLLGDTGMFIARLADSDGSPRFRIVVDQTMAAYAARMLTGA